MIDLQKQGLPQAVKVGGSFFHIHTGFKHWLRFFELVKEKKAPPAFDFMYTGKKPADRMAGFEALLHFANPPEKIHLPRGQNENEQPVLDYEVDADYIYAAFMQLYKIDLIDEDIHWYKFSALLRGIVGTQLSEIISIRTWENTDGTTSVYAREMQKRKDAWALPDETEDQALANFEAKIKG